MSGRWKNTSDGLEYIVNLKKGFILAEGNQMVPYPNDENPSDRLGVPAFHLLKIHRNYPFKLRYSPKTAYSADLICKRVRLDDLTDIPVRERRFIYDVASLFLIPRKYVPKWKDARAFELEKGFLNGKLNEPISLLYLANGVEICMGPSIYFAAPPEIRRRIYNFLSKKQEIRGYTNIPENPQSMSYGFANISFQDGTFMDSELIKILEKRFRTRISGK